MGKIQHWIQGCFACSLCSLWGFYCIFHVWMIRLSPCTSAFCLVFVQENGKFVLSCDTNLGTSRTIWKARTGFLLQWYHKTKSSFLFWTRAYPNILSKPYLNPTSYISCSQAPLLMHTPHSQYRYCKLVISCLSKSNPIFKSSIFLKAHIIPQFFCLFSFVYLFCFFHF